MSFDLRADALRLARSGSTLDHQHHHHHSSPSPPGWPITIFNISRAQARRPILGASTIDRWRVCWKLISDLVPERGPARPGPAEGYLTPRLRSGRGGGGGDDHDDGEGGGEEKRGNETLGGEAGRAKRADYSSVCEQWLRASGWASRTMQNVAPAEWTKNFKATFFKANTGRRCWPVPAMSLAPAPSMHSRQRSIETDQSRSH